MALSPSSLAWRLALFRVRRYRRPALLLLAVVVLAVAADRGWERLTASQVTLTIRVADAAYVSAVTVQSDCCAPAVAAVTLDTPTVTFRLKRGDYTISAAPSSAGFLQHWYYVPATIHLDSDRVMTLRGAYGRG